MTRWRGGPIRCRPSRETRPAVGPRTLAPFSSGSRPPSVRIAAPESAADQHCLPAPSFSGSHQWKTAGRPTCRSRWSTVRPRSSGAGAAFEIRRGSRRRPQRSARSHRGRHERHTGCLQRSLHGSSPLKITVISTCSRLRRTGPPMRDRHSRLIQANDLETTGPQNNATEPMMIIVKINGHRIGHGRDNF